MCSGGKNPALDNLGGASWVSSRQSPSPAHPWAAPWEASMAGGVHRSPQSQAPGQGHNLGARSRMLGLAPHLCPVRSGTKAVLLEALRIGGHIQMTIQEGPRGFRPAQKVWGALWVHVTSVTFLRSGSKVIKPDVLTELCNYLLGHKRLALQSPGQPVA